MAKRGRGYGSEDHFRRYRSERSSELDRYLVRALSGPDASLEWIYPTGKAGEREPTGVGFIADKRIQEMWRSFWPQRGRAHCWDGVARIIRDGSSEWLLIEAKSNVPEFVTPACGAKKEGGLGVITRSLNRLKTSLGVHRFYPWLGTYYQYANRLLMLDFLKERAGVSARLMNVYFTGDVFPDGTECPADEASWRALIEARRLTLGLPKRHRLSERCHEAFVPALRS
jgi:hypothetical protein